LETLFGKQYQLYHALNGQEAIDMFETYHPDLILMDIKMPVMDGYEATQEIRKYSAKVPIIAVTAFAYASDEQRVMENGFDGYMPKPINARQLKAQITEIMQKRIILL
jgi:CheY-like chemotaxis protein